jgi:hypothetical protein
MSRNIRVPYEDAARIRAAERDRALDLTRRRWPGHVPSGWSRSGQTLHRTIIDDKAGRIPAELEELILRFPSAPVHGFHRIHEHHVATGTSENFHTLRALRSALPKHRREPVSRIFLMHTGLNERDSMGHYYWLASLLVQQQPSTVCIVRPFPGHLTRYPFSAFAETPLDNYLRDGSHLFRQFLRFMLETQWFLSAIVRRSSYRVASSANLLGESDDAAQSRLEPMFLADAMQKAWRLLYDASRFTADNEPPDNQPYRPEFSPPIEDMAFFSDDIQSIRDTLKLDGLTTGSGDLSDGVVQEPSIHTLGYSLGGFTAQSVFMSWPFLVSSCATVLAGGALRELAPTVFADPEEWQTVLHSLRYELDDRLMHPYLGVDDEYVAGIDRELFVYLKRTFYEVFQQEYRGSIQTRYKEFRERLLFVVGGNDPVVRPESVLQSGPKGGLNLLEIAGLTHFLEGSGSDSSEKQQRAFWLPEMAELINRFANHAAESHQRKRQLTWFNGKLAKPYLSRKDWIAKIAELTDEQGSHKAQDDSDDVLRSVLPLTAAELVAIGKDGALPGPLFERVLDDLVFRNTTDANGVLFILRNELPSVLLDDIAVRETGAALYHDDINIVGYCHGVAARREVITRRIANTCLVLPTNARSIMINIDGQRGFPSQAETAGGGVMQRPSADELWRATLRQCRRLVERKDGRESLRRFDGKKALANDDANLDRVLGLARHYANQEDLSQVPSLCDCWMWVSRDLFAKTSIAKVDVGRGIRELPVITADVCESSRSITDQIRDEKIRIVSVSRARLNPRFRGRLIVDARSARRLLIHATLCLALSEPIGQGDLNDAFS